MRADSSGDARATGEPIPLRFDRAAYFGRHRAAFRPAAGFRDLERFEASHVRAFDAESRGEITGEIGGASGLAVRFQGVTDP